MIGMSIDKAKSQFFDRPTVIEAVGKARADVLRHGGGLVRKWWRRSMRKAPQKMIGELTKTEKNRFRMLQAIYKRKGLDPRKVRRPLRHSEPGEPPRTIRGDIKKFLFFAFDPALDNAVIGPVLIGKPTGAPENLEHGGRAEINGRTVTIAPRPAGQLALKANAPQLHRLWKDSMRKHYRM